MTDVRNPDDPVSAIIELRTKLDDMEKTLSIRTSRRPTGDIEPTILKAPKPNTLFLRGQSVWRADYPILWQWAQDNSLVDAAQWGMFSPGDGSTYFGLPDFTGRVLIGAGDEASAYPTVGFGFGVDSRVITISNLPAHDHRMRGDTGYGGEHGWHGNGTYNDIPGGSSGVVLKGPEQDNGEHDHLARDADDPNHELWMEDTGGGVAFDVRQRSLVVNWLIYV